MFHPRLNAGRYPRPRGSFAAWLFVAALALAGLAFPARQQWREWRGASSQAREEFNATWNGAGEAGRHRADVLYALDGDTFDARVNLPSEGEVTVRVRLRGIDAPEMKGACPKEQKLAEASTRALRVMLREGEVTLFNVGPDKYGRIVADVATARTPNVSSALIAAGHGRRYDGGHRGGWC